jgi:CRISPR/Cas system CMR subunit Cmr6 (Cas7 group RAMP superfamily)
MVLSQADRIVQLKERIKNLERKDEVNEKMLKDQQDTISTLNKKVLELSQELMSHWLKSQWTSCDRTH